MGQAGPYAAAIQPTHQGSDCDSEAACSFIQTQGQGALLPSNNVHLMITAVDQTKSWLKRGTFAASIHPHDGRT